MHSFSVPGVRSACIMVGVNTGVAWLESVKSPRMDGLKFESCPDSEKPHEPLDLTCEPELAITQPGDSGSRRPRLRRRSHPPDS
jgi:hypothetical protein